MKAKFTGDPSQPGEIVPDVMDHLGVTFHKDKFSEIPKDLESKFAGNNHFEVQGAKKADPEAETGESTREFADRVNAITDREGLEGMLETEKRPAARNALEQRIAALPAA